MKTTTRFACVLTSGVLLCVAGQAPLAGERRPPDSASGRDGAVAAVTPSALPVAFVENRGQWDGPAAFVARQGRIAAFLERDAIRLRLAADRPAEVSLTFDGASKDAALSGEDIRGGRYNFFIGSDARKWRSDVRAFAAVRYRGLYEGVDLRVLQREGRLEYDVLLAPGADLDRVVIHVAGASAIRVSDDGVLIVETPAGPLRQRAPTTWEELPDGTTRPLDSRFRTIDNMRYGFEVPGRDGTRPLVIDPGLEWSTFIGGSNREEIHGLALARDGSGDVVVAGSTWSSDFPTAPAGSLGSSPLIPFVARLNSTGTDLVYATLFGGTNGNVSFGFDLTLDASSAPIVVGETNAANFPTTPGAYQPRFNEPSTTINRGWDGFVTRFNASGSQMVFSTFLGTAPIFDSSRAGSSRGGDESARNVVVDSSDNVIVSGYTTSETFPTTAGAYDRTHSSLIVAVQDPDGTIESRADAFVARLSPNGTQLTYSTYLGGQSDDIVRDMVIDAEDVLTLVGIEAPLETFDGQGNRTDHGIPFPTTPDAVARTHLGASDTFVARLKLDGTGTGDLKYSTILGAFYIDEATSVALDPNNRELITLAGYSRSWDFPTTAGAWKRAPQFLADGVPYYSGFLVRFRFPAAGGGSLIWSTLVGGGATGQFADSVAIDPSGDVIVAGADIAGYFPTTERSFRRLPIKGDFVARFSGDGRTLLYSTLIHKPSGVLVVRKKVASSGPRAVVVAGSTLMTDFPTTPGAFDRVFGANGTGDGFHTYDGWVARFTLDPNASTDTTASAPALVSPANNAVIPLNGALTFDWTDVADASGVQFYEVQVSANAEFATGFTFFQLGTGTYTVSQSTGSASQEGIHYWRVRTLDGANNLSPWSEVRRLTVGAPTWTNFAAVSLSAEGVTAGNTILARVHIQNTAPAGGQVYTLTSSNPSAASVPASATIPAGQSSATFTITTHNVSASTPVMLTVWSEGNGDHPVFWVDPGAPPPPGTVTLSSVAVSPSSVTGGASSTGTVTLSGPAPAPTAVALSSSNSAASVPGTVTVAQGATTATFGITTSSVTSSTPVTITASSAGVSRSATLTVNALPPPPTPSAPALLSPTNQASVPLPVTLDWSDVSAAVSYRIQIDDSSTFSTPRVVDQTVTASQFTATSLASRQHWWRVRGLNSAGTAGAWSSVRSFTPQGAPAAAALSAVSVNPTSVVGGNPSQGMVTLTAAAPSGGFVVALGDNSSAATVPSSVTVAQGATSATFAIATTAVTASTSVAITAVAGSVTRTTTLSVTPAGQTGTVTLTVTASGRSGERITSSPAGINVSVGSSGSASFGAGTSVTLSVSNGRDAIWSGACSSGGNKRRTCTFTLNATASVTANVQ